MTDQWLLPWLVREDMEYFGLAEARRILSESEENFKDEQ